MSSVPASSLRTLPPNDGQDSVSSSSSSRSSNRRLLSQSLSGDYGSTVQDERENSGSTLVSPIIDESEIEVEGGGYLRRSTDSLNRQRAKLAANTLQGRRERAGTDDDWYVIANPERRKKNLTSDLQTFIHLLKGNVGTGLLAMPLAVKYAGYILGPIGLLVLGIIATHCMLLLAKCSQYLSRRHGVDSLNYAEVMKFAILERTSTPALGTAGLYMVNLFLILTQFGFCAVYFVFMGDSMRSVADSAFHFTLTTQQGIAIILPLIIVCCWIRELEGLTMFSLIANICIVFSLAVIFYELLYQLFSDDGEEMAAIRRDPDSLSPLTFKTFPLYFGSAVYAFEGIGVVLPLENKMENPNHFKRIVISGMILIVAVYTTFGLLGYLVYGEDICPSITLNLGSGRTAANTVFIIVVLYYGYVVFASFMLQFYVPMDFLEIPFFKLIRLDSKIDRLSYSHPHLHGPAKWIAHTIFRTTIVLITAGLAFGIPDLEGLITLIGAVASAALAFIFPPLLQLLAFWRERPPCLTLTIRGTQYLTIPWLVTVIKCLAIIILGVLGSVTGTVFALISIAHYFENGGQSCPKN